MSSHTHPLADTLIAPQPTLVSQLGARARVWAGEGQTLSPDPLRRQGDILHCMHMMHQSRWKRRTGSSAVYWRTRTRTESGLKTHKRDEMTAMAE